MKKKMQYSTFTATGGLRSPSKQVISIQSQFAVFNRVGHEWSCPLSFGEGVGGEEYQPTTINQ